MLKITLFEFVFRGIPEMTLIILASYIFTKTKIDKKNFIVALILSVIGIFAIRCLPIIYGVHTIMNIIYQTIIVVKVCKIDAVKAIKASILSAIILFIAEFINVGLLNIILGDNMAIAFSNSKIKTICGIPSILIFCLTIYIYNTYMKRGNKYVSNGMYM